MITAGSRGIASGRQRAASAGRPGVRGDGVGGGAEGSVGDSAVSAWHMFERAYALLIVMATASACLPTYPPPWRPTVEVAVVGPPAVRFWFNNRLNTGRGRPSDAEVAAFREDLSRAVKAYLAERPSVSPAAREALGKQHITLGMTHEEIHLLMGEPWERGTETDTSKRHAWEHWPMIADEVWAYRHYYALDSYTVYAAFFRQGRVETILSYSWGAL